MSDEPAFRIGTDERVRALDNLQLHFELGRLTPEEYEARSATAAAARTRADLVPLFADLPAAADGSPLPATADGEVEALPLASVPARSRVKDTMMGLTPLAVVAGFFVLNAAGTPMAWLLFLLIPAMGILLYGPERSAEKRGRHEPGRRTRERD